jgi:hypothetical protein
MFVTSIFWYLKLVFKGTKNKIFKKIKDYDKEAKYMNKPSKTQMSEPKKKTKNQKQNTPVVSWWVGIVRWAEATKPREVERDRTDGGWRHWW